MVKGPERLWLLHVGGNYTAGAASVFMPPDSDRPNCASETSGNAAAVATASSGVLDIADLAGIFIIQARIFVM